MLAFARPPFVLCCPSELLLAGAVCATIGPRLTFITSYQFYYNYLVDFILPAVRGDFFHIYSAKYLHTGNLFMQDQVPTNKLLIFFLSVKFRTVNTVRHYS